jgi:excisionase family DNA binding protein
MKKQPEESTRYLSVKDVAQELGLAVSTVYALIYGGHLPSTKLPGLDRVLVPREAFQNYLAAAK